MLMAQAFGDAFFADHHELRFGGVKHVERRFALVGGAGNGCRADEHELAQQALVFNDADVLFDDRPARQPLGERREISDAADRLDFLILGQFVGQGDEVDGVSVAA